MTKRRKLSKAILLTSLLTEPSTSSSKKTTGDNSNVFEEKVEVVNDESGDRKLAITRTSAAVILEMAFEDVIVDETVAEMDESGESKSAATDPVSMISIKENTHDYTVCKPELLCALKKDGIGQSVELVSIERLLCLQCSLDQNQEYLSLLYKQLGFNEDGNIILAEINLETVPCSRCDKTLAT